MPLEPSFDFPDDLVVTNPASIDTRREGDDHIRGIKTVLRNFSKDLNGVVASSSHMDQIYPIGTMLAFFTGISNPGDFIGGTWALQGKITLDDVEAGSNADTGYPGGVEQISFYWRTA
jgi:hypothetical protein